MYVILANPIFASQQNEFTLGVERIDYYPYYTTNISGKYIGFAKDLFDYFSKKNNISFTYEPRPVARLIDEFLKGRLDFKFPDSSIWRKDLKEKYDIIYSDDVVDFVDGIIVKVENKNKEIGFLKDVGTIIGFTVIDNYKKIHFEESSNIETLIEKLNANRLDGIYINIAVGMNFINNNSKLKNKFIFRKDFPHKKGTYKLSTIKHKELIKTFNKFLKKESKEIKLLKDKYKLNY